MLSVEIREVWPPHAENVRKNHLATAPGTAAEEPTGRARRIAEHDFGAGRSCRAR